MSELVARGKVGSKGELFPPRGIREGAGLSPHDDIEFRVEGEEIVVRRVVTIDDLLRERKPKVALSQQEFRRIRRSLSQEVERV